MRRCDCPRALLMGWLARAITTPILVNGSRRWGLEYWVVTCAHCDRVLKRAEIEVPKNG